MSYHFCCFRTLYLDPCPIDFSRSGKEFLSSLKMCNTDKIIPVINSRCHASWYTFSVWNKQKFMVAQWTTNGGRLGGLVTIGWSLEAMSHEHLTIFAFCCRARLFSKSSLSRLQEFWNSLICLYEIKKKNLSKFMCRTGSFTCPGPSGSGKRRALCWCHMSFNGKGLGSPNGPSRQIFRSPSRFIGRLGH